MDCRDLVFIKHLYRYPFCSFNVVVACQTLCPIIATFIKRHQNTKLIITNIREVVATRLYNIMNLTDSYSESYTPVISTACCIILFCLLSVRYWEHFFLARYNAS